MPISPLEHAAAERMIATAIAEGNLPDKIRELHECLEGFAAIARTRLMTSKEHHDSNIMIELLVRAEGAFCGGGWYFRLKRRFQITNLYFKPR